LQEGVSFDDREDDCINFLKIRSIWWDEKELCKRLTHDV